MSDDVTAPAAEHEILTVVRPDLYQLLDSKLDVDAAAAEIQRWSDKIRHLHMPADERPGIREWAAVPPAGRELYKFMVYRVICQLVDSDPIELLEIVDRVLEKVRPAKNREAA